MRLPLYLESDSTGSDLVLRLSRCKNCGKVKVLSRPCGFDHLAAVMDFNRAAGRPEGAYFVEETRAHEWLSERDLERLDYAVHGTDCDYHDVLETVSEIVGEHVAGALSAAADPDG